MKRYIAMAAALVFLGAGCSNDAAPANAPAPSQELGTYRSEEFGFAFDHPKAFEMKERLKRNRDFEYIGLNVDFFSSLRDTSRGEDPENIAYFYASPELSIEEVKTAITEGTPGDVEITGEETREINGLTVVGLKNSTQLGEEKTHYIADIDGRTLIISVFLGEDENFNEVVETLRAL